MSDTNKSLLTSKNIQKFTSGDEEKLSSHGENDANHHHNKCYNVTMDLISFILAITEIFIVIWLSYSHFSHSMGLIAIAMLLPIFCNVIGVTYFLSE